MLSKYRGLCNASNESDDKYTDTTNVLKTVDYRVILLADRPMHGQSKGPTLYVILYRTPWSVPGNAFSALTLLVGRHGRASGLQKSEWWDVGVVICLG